MWWSSCSLFIHLTLGWPISYSYSPKIWQDHRCWNFKTQFWNSQKGQSRAKDTASDSLLPRKSFPLSPSFLHSRTSPAAGHSTHDECKSTQIPQRWTTRMPTLWNLFLLWLCFSPRGPEHDLGSDHRSRFILVQPRKEEMNHEAKSEVIQKTPLRKQPGIFRGQINYLKHGDLCCALCKRGRLLPVRKSWLRTWKQPRCPSADEWIRKLWYIYTMEYYSAIKKNSFVSVLMRWMKLEPIIQSEVSQKDKEHYSILIHI